MDIEVKLMDLAEGVSQGEIVRVCVDKGSVVEKGQILMEIESNKALIDLPAEMSGKVSQIFVSAGDTVEVGKTLLSITPSDSPKQNRSDEVVEKTLHTPTPNSGQEVMDISLPSLGEGVEEGELISIAVQEGDHVEKSEILMTFDMNKATVDFPSDHSGVVEKIYVSVGSIVKIGTVLFRIKLSSISSAQQDILEEKSAVLPSQREVSLDSHKSLSPNQSSFESRKNMNVFSGLQRKACSPSLRKRATVLGVSLDNIVGTGRGGRITLEDFDRYLLNKQSGEQVTEMPPLPDFSQWGTIESKPYASVRKKTGDHLSLSWKNIPHVTQFDEADVTALEAMRQEKNKELKDRGVKITPTVFLLKGVAECLKKFPEFASSLDEKAKKMIYKQYCHIGVAVDTPRGLMVPVIRDVDQKSIENLSSELIDIGSRAKKSKLKPSELQGGVFTVSSLGHLGGRFFTPIINTPEVAILGVSRQSYQAVVCDGQIVSRLILPYALSYDHRIIDGVAGVRFTRYLAEYLENISLF